MLETSYKLKILLIGKLVGGKYTFQTIAADVRRPPLKSAYSNMHALGRTPN